ncbi:N-formyl-4-amino-5-aminomethyl-2-methylpyrimidine deformylase [subsurface metagenome]
MVIKMKDEDLFKKIDAIVCDYEKEIISLAKNLVKIPSENIVPDGFEKKAQEFLYYKLKDTKYLDLDMFTPLEVKEIIDHPAYFKGRNYKDRPNVVGKIKGKSDSKSIIFSSHMDTVTRNPLPWKENDPFSGKIEDGNLYGRGSLDMKGQIASTFILLKIVSDLNIELDGSLIVESVVDEENAGSNGTLASRLRGYNADIAIVPEPSMLSVCPACKGGKVYKVVTEGKAGTGYGGEELINPAYGLGALMRSISDYYDYINSNANPSGFFYKGEKKPREVILDKVQIGDLSPGGNITIPGKAWFSIFIQSLPGYSEQDLDNEFSSFILNVAKNDKKFLANMPKITGITRYLWPFETNPDHPSIPLIKESFEGFSGQSPKVEGAKFACDGFIFHKYFNTPTIIFGPRGGNAHAQDEFVKVGDLILLTKIFLYVVLKWCGGKIN